MQDFEKTNQENQNASSLEGLPTFDEHMKMERERINQKILTARDKTPEERIQAAREIENKEAIEQVAYGDRDINVRLAALEKVTSPRVLVEILDDENEEISEAARVKLIDLLQNMKR